MWLGSRDHRLNLLKLNSDSGLLKSALERYIVELFSGNVVVTILAL